MQASNAQSHLRFTLTHLFASGGHVRVLRALMAYAAPLSVAQLAADSGLTRRGTRFVLSSLASQGMVRVLGQPRSQLYDVDCRHRLALAVKSLFEHERANWEALQQALRDELAALKDVRSAWLYGSVASGEDGPGSDVDVALVVAEDDSNAADRVRDAILAIGDRLSLHLSSVVLTPRELVSRATDDRWWNDLEQSAKVLKGLSPNKEASRCRAEAVEVNPETMQPVRSSKA